MLPLITWSAARRSAGRGEGRWLSRLISAVRCASVSARVCVGERRHAARPRRRTPPCAQSADRTRSGATLPRRRAATTYLQSTGATTSHNYTPAYYIVIILLSELSCDRRLYLYLVITFTRYPVSTVTIAFTNYIISGMLIGTARFSCCAYL